MTTWLAFVQAFVYPIARAWADAWFDAMRKASEYQEEAPNATDANRAARFRESVNRLQQRTYDTRPEYSPQAIPPSNPVDISTATTRTIKRSRD